MSSVPIGRTLETHSRQFDLSASLVCAPKTAVGTWRLGIGLHVHLENLSRGPVPTKSLIAYETISGHLGIVPNEALSHDSCAYPLTLLQLERRDPRPNLLAGKPCCMFALTTALTESQLFQTPYIGRGKKEPYSSCVFD